MYMCVYMYVYIHIRDVHLMTDTIHISIHSQRYIKDTYEAGSDAIWFTPLYD